jgi:hypothetical protein
VLVNSFPALAQATGVLLESGGFGEGVEPSPEAAAAGVWAAATRLQRRRPELAAAAAAAAMPAEAFGDSGSVGVVVAVAKASVAAAVKSPRIARAVAIALGARLLSSPSTVVPLANELMELVTYGSTEHVSKPTAESDLSEDAVLDAAGGVASEDDGTLVRLAATPAAVRSVALAVFSNLAAAAADENGADTAIPPYSAASRI